MATSHSPSPEEVMAYLDGETPRDERLRMEAHLAECESCKEVVRDLLDVSRGVATWQVDAPPPTLHAPKPKRSSWIAPAWMTEHRRAAGAVAAGLLLAAVVFLPVILPLARKEAPSANAEVYGSAGGQADSARQYVAPHLRAAAPGTGPAQTMAPPSSRQPMLIRTATLSLLTRDFASARPAVERIVRELGGFIDQMTAIGTEGTTRSLRGTVRIPGARLDEALTRMRQLGQVLEDTQRAEDVTDQIVDLDARLANARATERRLADILRERTGRLADVLEVEREITRVRLDIERLDAERATLGRRVTYAAVTFDIAEERKARLDGPLPIVTRLRMAFAEGLQTALDSILALTLTALRAGPTLLFWLALGTMVWLVVRRLAGPGTRRGGLFTGSQTPRASE